MKMSRLTMLLWAALAWGTPHARAQALEQDKICPPHGLVGLAHGLNNPPSLMSEIAEEFKAMGYGTKLLELSGHRADSPLSEMRNVSAETWSTEFSNFMKQLHSQASACKKPAHFVGYSMGALLHAHFLAQQKSSNVNSKLKGKSVYLAPAIRTHNFARLVTWLPLWNSIVLPSFNHPSAIAQEGSSMAAFRALFDIQNDFHDKASTELKRHNVLILTDPKDELVSFSRTNDFIHKLELNPTWKQLAFEPSSNAKKFFKHHLFLTRQSAGSRSFEELIQTMHQFLSTQ